MIAEQPLADVVGAGVEVPLVQGGQARYVNLDYAATAPCLRVVADRVAELLPWYASVHRGAGFLSQVCTEVYESARATIAGHVGARADDVVIFTRNTTDALNLLARCVAAKGPVLVLDIEHHANLLPWQEAPHRVVAAAPTLAATLQQLEDACSQRDFALVAITGASNVTGEVVPIGRVAEIAHGHGARLLVDGAQLVPHQGVDMRGTGADYLAFSGHKTYAPFGAGALVGRRDWLDDGPPYLAGGGAVLEVGLETTQWRPSPERHEGGTPNVLGVAALAAAVEALDEIGPDRRQAHEMALRQRLEAGLAELAEVHRLRIWADQASTVGINAFSVEGHDTALLATVLACEHGVGLREGRFCAHLLFNKLNQGQGVIRASYGLGSCLEDIDRLVEGLRCYLSGQRVWRYSDATGAWAPLDDARTSPFGLGRTGTKAAPAAL